MICAEDVMESYHIHGLEWDDLSYELSYNSALKDYISLKVNIKTLKYNATIGDKTILLLTLLRCIFDIPSRFQIILTISTNIKS